MTHQVPSPRVPAPIPDRRVLPDEKKALEPPFDDKASLRRDMRPERVYEDAIRELTSELAADREVIAQKENALALLIMLSERRRSLNYCTTAVPVSSAEQAAAVRCGPEARRAAHSATATPRVTSGAIRDPLLEAVRTVVSTMTACEIRAVDVYNRLEASGTHVLGKHPRQYVGAALDRLVDAGVLKRVTTGRGRMPNAYRHQPRAAG
jgi:hypothetical protein